MNELISKIKTMTNTKEINEMLIGLKKKELMLVAKELGIPWMSRDDKEEIRRKIVSTFGEINRAVALMNMLKR